MLLLTLINSSLLGITITSIIIIKELEGTIIILKSRVYLLHKSHHSLPTALKGAVFIASKRIKIAVITLGVTYICVPSVFFYANIRVLE